MASTDLPSAWSEPPYLAGRHVALEPLAMAHADGLRNAAGDGELAALWYTNVPKPDDVDAYIAATLAMQARGQALAFAVRNAAGEVVGTTRYYDLDPAVPRLSIGYTWYARKAQRTGLNTEAKLLLLGTPSKPWAASRWRSRPAGSTTPRGPRSRDWAPDRTACCAAIVAMPMAASAIRSYSRSSNRSGRR